MKTGNTIRAVLEADGGRKDVWKIAGTHYEDLYPTCTYTLPGFQGHLEGKMEVYVVGKRWLPP